MIMMFLVFVFSCLIFSSSAVINPSGTSTSLGFSDSSSQVFFSPIVISPNGQYALVLGTPQGSEPSSFLNLINLQTFVVSYTLEFSCEETFGTNIQFSSDTTIWVACSSLASKTTTIYEIALTTQISPVQPTQPMESGESLGKRSQSSPIPAPSQSSGGTSSTSLVIVATYQQSVGVQIGSPIPGSSGGFYAAGGFDGQLDTFFTVSPSSVQVLFSATQTLGTQKYSLNDWVVSSGNIVASFRIGFSQPENFLLISQSGGIEQSSSFSSAVIRDIALDSSTATTGFSVFGNGNYGSYSIATFDWTTLQPTRSSVSLPYAGPALYNAVTASNYFIVSLETTSGPCGYNGNQYFNTLTQISRVNWGTVSSICLPISSGGPFQWDTPIAADGSYVYVAQDTQFIRYSYSN